MNIKIFKNWYIANNKFFIKYKLYKNIYTHYFKNKYNLTFLLKIYINYLRFFTIISYSLLIYKYNDIFNIVIKILID